MTADIHTLTGAYVIDALSGRERTAFERHVTECAACAQEVAELRETAGRLGAAASTQVPVRLKQRVLAEAARTRQLPPAREARPQVSRTRRWPAWVAGTAAAASIVAAVGLGVNAAQTNQRLTDELAQLRATNSELGEVLAAPDAQVASGPSATGGAGIAVVSRSQHKVIFLAEGLPALPANRTYQLWLIGPQGARSGGLLQSGDRPLLAEDVDDIQQVALTVEPAGGSPQGTTPPILQVTLNG